MKTYNLIKFRFRSALVYEALFVVALDMNKAFAKKTIRVQRVHRYGVQWTCYVL